MARRLRQVAGRPSTAAGVRSTLALAEQAGFSGVREAVRTPFNIVYELRP
jgi:hypothetical protein